MSSNEHKRNRRRIISLDLDIIGYNEVLRRILDKASNREPSFVCFANVHMVVEAKLDSDTAHKINSADFVLADGMPLVNAISFLFKEKQNRIAGMDVMPDLMRMAEKENQSVFFFGSTQEQLNRIREKAKVDFPKLIIAGALSPPFSKKLKDKDYCEQINNSGANLVFVGLGCPKQERWMSENSHEIRAILLGVGGAFPVYSGLKRRAPLWMQKCSLEWFYRFIQEPKRMWKRYLITNSVFLYSIFGQLILTFFKGRKKNEMG